MRDLKIGAAIIVAGVLVILAVAATSYKSPGSTMHLVSMDESGRAMQQAGAIMLTHGQAMLDESNHTGKTDLAFHGKHWMSDGQALVLRGQVMAADPLASDVLHASKQDLTNQGNWRELVRNAQAMQHDTRLVSSTDLEALRWNGLSMLSEGKSMADHGRTMTDEIAAMVKQYLLPETFSRDLRGAAQTMQRVGDNLTQNEQAMLDYVDEMRRTIGAR